MPINKEFDAQNRAMAELVARRNAANDWDSDDQRKAAEMVVRILWTLARCRVPPPAGLQFLREEMDKLGTDREAGG